MSLFHGSPVVGPLVGSAAPPFPFPIPPLPFGFPKPDMIQPPANSSNGYFGLPFVNNGGFQGAFPPAPGFPLGNQPAGIKEEIAIVETKSSGASEMKKSKETAKASASFASGSSKSVKLIKTTEMSDSSTSDIDVVDEKPKKKKEKPIVQPPDWNCHWLGCNEEFDNQNDLCTVSLVFC